MKPYFNLIKDSNYIKFDLKITLKPSFRCNQSCWFCTEYNNNSHMWKSKDCFDVIDALKKIIKPNMKIFFYFYGGEPTLSKFWEQLHVMIINEFYDNFLFIQTQTNLSLNIDRLRSFANSISNISGPNHKIEICSSYHPFKQDANDFVEKMKVLDLADMLGYCFFSTDLTDEKKMMTEFDIINDIFPHKLKFRFTEIHQNYVPQNYPIMYKGKNTEYNYMIDKYGIDFLNKYIEDEFIFETHDNEYNFNEVLNQDKNEFQLYKCECYTKNLVIDHNLNVYHCNDDFKNNFRIYKLEDICSNFISKNSFCLNKKCYDGLEFKKWK